MFAVKVEYEVFPEYEGENKDRIQDFLKAFEGLDNSRFRYSVFQDRESKRFIHLSEYKDEVIQTELLSNPIFLKFQEQRDKNLKEAPSITWLDCVL